MVQIGKLTGPPMLPARQWELCLPIYSFRMLDFNSTMSKHRDSVSRSQ